MPSAHTDADAAPRTTRFLLKLLLAAGIAVAGWLLVGALGGTASADENPGDTQGSTGQSHAGHSRHTQSHGAKQQTEQQTQPQQQRLLGTLTGGVVDPLVATVDQVTGSVTGALPGSLGQTVQSTLSTVTGTVTTLTDQVAGTADAIVEPLVGPLVHPIVDQVVAPVTHAVVPPVTEALKPDTGTTAPGGSTPTTPTTPVAPTTPTTPTAPPVTAAAQGAPAAQAQQVTVVQQAGKQHARTATAAVRAGVTTQHEQAKAADQGNAPEPAPGAPGSQLVGGTPAHDTGSGAKSPLAALSGVAGTTELTSTGAATRHALDDNSREAALPTTSPD